MVWICVGVCNFENFKAYFDLYRGNNTNVNAVPKLSFAGVCLFSSSVSHDFYFLNFSDLSVALSSNILIQLLKTCWMFRISWRPFDSQWLIITFYLFFEEIVGSSQILWVHIKERNQLSLLSIRVHFLFWQTVSILMAILLLCTLCKSLWGMFLLRHAVAQSCLWLQVLGFWILLNHRIVE